MIRRIIVFSMFVLLFVCGGWAARKGDPVEGTDRSPDDLARHGHQAANPARHPAGPRKPIHPRARLPIAGGLRHRSRPRRAPAWERREAASRYGARIQDLAPRRGRPRADRITEVSVNTIRLTHSACIGHDPGPGHPERPDRLRAFRYRQPRLSTRLSVFVLPLLPSYQNFDTRKPLNYAHCSSRYGLCRARNRHLLCRNGQPSDLPRYR